MRAEIERDVFYLSDASNPCVSIRIEQGIDGGRVPLPLPTRRRRGSAMLIDETNRP